MDTLDDFMTKSRNHGPISQQFNQRLLSITSSVEMEVTTKQEADLALQKLRSADDHLQLLKREINLVLREAREDYQEVSRYINAAKVSRAIKAETMNQYSNLQQSILTLYEGIVTQIDSAQVQIADIKRETTALRKELD